MTRRKLETTLERIARTGDPLYEMQRELVGRAVRLHVPLKDVPDLARIATIMRVTASRLEVLSKDPAKDVSVLFSARQALRLANAQMNSRHALGKNDRL